MRMWLMWETVVQVILRIGLVQITRDHSWIAEMVMGELKEEVWNHP